MTTYILAVTIILSITALNNEQVMRKMIFNPYLIQHKKEWFRFITSGFIHADWMHLIINMLVLYSFGGVVERYYNEVFDLKGEYYYGLLYFGGMLIAVAPSYAKHKNDPGYNALGASGAVSAVIFTAILFNPLQKIYLYGVVGLPGIVLGPGYLAYSYYMSKKGGDHINHDAHFWGAVFGVLFTILLKPSIALYFINEITGQ
jgi:membrane associated rhomboid family serine protease